MPPILIQTANTNDMLIWCVTSEEGRNQPKQKTKDFCQTGALQEVNLCRLQNRATCSNIYSTLSFKFIKIESDS